MNFCPQCGTQRSSGQFCAGCGLRFPENISPDGPIRVVLREEGWYANEADKNFERFWNGTEWTEDVRFTSEYEAVRRNLFENLEYGPGYSEQSNCYNCGAGRAKRVKACSSCGVSL